MRKRWIALLVWLGLVLTVFLIYSVAMEVKRGSPEEVETHQFAALLSDGQIADIDFEDDGFIVGTRRVEEGQTATKVRTFTGDQQWIRDIARQRTDVSWNEEKPSTGSGYYMVFQLVFYGLFIVAMIFLWRMKMKGPGGGLGDRIARSKAKAIEGIQSDTLFRDVAGADEAVEDVQDVVEFLKNPEKFRALGAQAPKGILLTGPPGTGKTLLARALAGEAGVPFFLSNGSEFVEMFVGVGAARVRDLFERAHKKAPCIIFIDEIDGVAGKRGGLGRGGHEEREQTLNQILVELDGFTEHDNVVVIAATNRPDMLDSGLVRSGRFDRKVHMSKPTIRGREAILNVHLRKRGIVLTGEVTSATIAALTPGMTGADLETLLKEAATRAAKLGKKAVDGDDVKHAVDKVLMGPERRSVVMTAEEKLRTAFHEIGHAIPMHLLAHSEPLYQVTVIPRGQALGLTQSITEIEKYGHSRRDVEALIQVMLGGRAAEDIVFEGNTSNGCCNDFDRATALAKAMVMRWAMGKQSLRTFGSVDSSSYMGEEYFQRDFSDAALQTIDGEVEGIIQENYAKVKQLLEERRDDLVRLSRQLYAEETLGRSDIEEVLGEKGGRSLPECVARILEELAPPEIQLAAG